MKQIAIRKSSLQSVFLGLVALVLFSIPKFYSLSLRNRLHLHFLPLTLHITEAGCAFPLGLPYRCPPQISTIEVQSVEDAAKQIVAESSSHHSSAHELLGSTHLLAGNYETSQRYFLDAYEHNPTELNKLLLASTLDAQDKSDDLLGFLANSEANTNNILEAGYVEYRWGNEATAFERFRLYQTLEPQAASSALAYMATIRKDQERWQESAELFQTALQIDQGWHKINQRLAAHLNYVRMLRELAKASEASGKAAQRIVQLETGLRTLAQLQATFEESNRDVLFLQGQLLLDLGRLSEAKRTFEQMSEAFPEEYRGFLYLGIATYPESVGEAEGLMVTAVSLDSSNQALKTACSFIQNQSGSEGIVNFNQRLVSERIDTSC